MMEIVVKFQKCWITDIFCIDNTQILQDNENAFIQCVLSGIIIKKLLPFDFVCDQKVCYDCRSMLNIKAEPLIRSKEKTIKILKDINLNY